LPDTFSAQSGKWQLLPDYHLFGSEELSSRSPAIMELISAPSISLCAEDAAALAANLGDTIIAEIDGHDIALKLNIVTDVAAGCASYSIGVPDAAWLAPSSSVRLRKASTAGSGGGDV
jgi:NADH-quinone oxidoreductase subunit G